MCLGASGGFSDLQNLLARLHVGQGSALVVALHEVKQPVVRARLVKVVEPAETLLDEQDVVGKQLQEAVQAVLRARGVGWVSEKDNMQETQASPCRDAVCGSMARAAAVALCGFETQALTDSPSSPILAGEWIDATRNSCARFGWHESRCE